MTGERVRDRVVLRDAVARVGPGEHGLAGPRTAATAAPDALTAPALAILRNLRARDHDGEGETTGERQ